MRYKLEHKPNTPGSGEKYLVLDTTNPYPVGNSLHDGYMGCVIAECESKHNGELVVNALLYLHLNRELVKRLNVHSLPSDQQSTKKSND